MIFKKNYYGIEMRFVEYPKTTFRVHAVQSMFARCVFCV
jgi:hypothetical protein